MAMEVLMRLNEYLLAEFEREADRSRRALLELPEGNYDWKPHEKSMILGYLAELVATIPTWVVMQVNTDELDVAPVNGSTIKREPLKTVAALTDALDTAAKEVREVLQRTTEDHLKTPWRLKAQGQVVQTASRFDMICDTLNHWVHHRGQMTVYLRLMGAKVPALYGPSADDRQFR
jgi:uncharacterized damage-inducible protein DinB